MAAATPVAIIVAVSMSLSAHGNSSNSPTKESGGPGSAGSTAPKSPATAHSRASITKIYSILYFVNENLRLTPKSVVVVGYELAEISGIVFLRSTKKLMFSILL